MKMTKYLVLGILLAAGYAHAAIYWSGDLHGGDTVSWEDPGNWALPPAHVLAPSTLAPGAADLVILNHLLPVTLAFPSIPIVGTPVLSTVSTIWGVGSGWGSEGGQGLLTIVAGGDLSVIGGWYRNGHNDLGTGTLDMTGGHLYAEIFQNGFNEGVAVGGYGVVNLSGDAVLDADHFEWGQDNPSYDPWPGAENNGSGVVNISGSAKLRIGGDKTGEGWIAEDRILTSDAGQVIWGTYLAGSDVTEFVAVPEPATLGLFALVGGGMLWIRKRSTT